MTEAAPSAGAWCQFWTAHETHDETILRRPMNTRYVDDERNWLTCCRACYERAWNDYDSMWDDSGQGHPFARYAPPDPTTRSEP